MAANCFAAPVYTWRHTQTALCSFSQRSEAYASIVGCQVFYRSAAQKARLFALLAGKSAVKPRLAG